MTTTMKTIKLSSAAQGALDLQIPTDVCLIEILNSPSPLIIPRSICRWMAAQILRQRYKLEI
jgi:hypothetical protein